MSQLGIINSFVLIVTTGDVGYSKPNEKIFEIACSRSNSSTADCFYIGDNLENDVLACEKIGMKGIWLDRQNSESDKRNVLRVNSLLEIRDTINSFRS